MLKILPTRPIKFTQNKNEEYKDPLMTWPARGLAYSNELGAALSEIAPRLGTLLWFPAMLYFGADIYDKYKNDQTSYDPQRYRGTQQAIFQLMASVILPTASVILGQKTASALGALGKKGLTLQTQEEIVHFLQGFTERRHLDKYNNNVDEFKALFVESLATKREKLIRKNKYTQPFIQIKDSLVKNKHPEALAILQKDKVFKYANEHIDEMFKIYNNLENNKKPVEFSNKMWKKFNKLKNKYANDVDYRNTHIRDAAEDIIKKYQKNKILNAKLLKTAGGFIALGLAIKPIDMFVEHFIIKKVVQPINEKRLAAKSN